MPALKAVKSRASGKNHWSALSDEELLSRSLTTDSPETLEGLVTYIPERHAEAHVEFKYDFRGQDREWLHCVHGHHAHLAGLVMRVGEERFLVGWMCGKSIYGEDFERYTQAYDDAVMRQNALLRARRIANALEPFKLWLRSVPHFPAFQLYPKLRAEWHASMPWLYDQLRIKCLKHAGKLTVRETVRDEDAERLDDLRVQRETELYHHGGDAPQPSRKPIYKDQMKELCEIPAKLFFEGGEDLSAAAFRVCNEIFYVLPSLERALKESKEFEDQAARIRERLTRLEGVIAEVKALEALFQPAMLAAIAEWASVSDGSRREYKAGLTDITMKSRKGSCTVALPVNYQTPSVAAIGQFRTALAGLAIPD